MAVPTLPEVFADMAEVMERSAKLMRNPALNGEILDMMIENMEHLTSQMYRIRTMMFMYDI